MLNKFANALNWFLNNIVTEEIVVLKKRGKYYVRTTTKLFRGIVVSVEEVSAIEIAIEE